jgi:hypothetical protein
MGNKICTWAAGTTRSAGFVRDFISVVPFFAWQHLHVHMQAKGTATLSSSIQQVLGHRPAPRLSDSPHPFCG